MTQQLSLTFGEAASDESSKEQSGLFQELKDLVSAGSIKDIDYYFTVFLKERFGETNEAALKAAAFLTYANRQGHVGVELSAYGADVPLFRDSENMTSDEPVLKGEANWASEIKSAVTVGDGTSDEPMILEGNRLYLRKYWKYESDLAGIIATKCEKSRSQFTSSMSEPDEEVTRQVKDTLSRLFPSESDGHYLQKAACIAALLNSFTVITGGPGTGKTYTVLRLLALLTELASQEKTASLFNLQTPLRVAIAAPTGKAATRVRESILESKNDLPVSEELKAQIPTEAHTLHRLLKTIHNSPNFRHNAENPLPYDVIIVDEASMVDLALMYKLVSALRPETRLILLGDKDQLASVEAGAVLGDICRSEGPLNYVTPQYAQFLRSCGLSWPEKMTDANVRPLGDAITELTESRRFSDDSGIGKLASTINLGDADQTLSILCDSRHDNVVWPESKGISSIMEPYTGHLKKLTEPGITAEKAFGLIKERQILCAHRKGRYGSEYINRELERVIRPASGRFASGPWYPGRVVMFTHNDYNLDLFNGDIGIALYNSDRDRIEVHVERPSKDGATSSFEALSPAQAGGCETAFAMSVHKSQGSEFKHVLLVLPEKPSPVLTKELLYTALTRASNSFEIFGKKEVLRHAVQEKVRRTSGLADRLWENGG